MNRWEERDRELWEMHIQQLADKHRVSFEFALRTLLRVTAERGSAGGKWTKGEQITATDKALSCRIALVLP